MHEARWTLAERRGSDTYRSARSRFAAAILALAPAWSAVHALPGADETPRLEVPREASFLAIDYQESGGYGIRTTAGEELDVIFRTRVYGDERVVQTRPTPEDPERELEFFVSAERVQSAIENLQALRVFASDRHAVEAEVRRLNQRSGTAFLVTDLGLCELVVRAMGESNEYPGELVLVETTVGLSAVAIFAEHFPESEILQDLGRALQIVNWEFAQRRSRGY